MGAIVEDVTQVGLATVTEHFGASHPVGVIGFFGHGVFGGGGPKAGPTSARIKLGVGAKQWLSAGGADVGAFFLVLVVLAGKGALGALLAHDGVLLRRQALLPLAVGFNDLVGGGGRIILCHKASIVDKPQQDRKGQNGFSSHGYEYAGRGGLDDLLPLLPMRISDILQRPFSEPLLFMRHPRLPHLRWISLADVPTPVQLIASQAGAADIWVKRDDLSSAIYGGNKVRKYEFILADALARGCDHLVTFGGLGSHHCLALAAFGRQLDMSATLVHFPQPMTRHVSDMLRWQALQGAQFRLAPNLPFAYLTALWEMQAVRMAGRRPYFVWAGASNPLGTLGFINAGLELAEQVASGAMPRPKTIIVATGTGSTLAGLVIAMKLLGWDTRVLGVRIAPRYLTHATGTLNLAKRTLRWLEKFDPAFRSAQLGRGDFDILDGYLGRGYGWPTLAGDLANEIFMRDAGVALESTYTAKAFAATLDYARVHPEQGPYMFWNTHNSTKVPQLPPPSALPERYQHLI